MIIVVNAENRSLFELDLIAMYRLRKAIFIDRAGWKLSVVADQEIDPPRGPAIGDVSRFCTTQDLPSRGIRFRLLWEVIRGVTETALLYGIERVTFVANRTLLPLALICGCEVRKLGDTLRDDDDGVTAATAVISPSGLRQVRCYHGISIAAMRFNTLRRATAPTDLNLALASMNSAQPLSALGRPRRSISTRIYHPPETSPMAEAVCLSPHATSGAPLLHHPRLHAVSLCIADAVLFPARARVARLR